MTLFLKLKRVARFALRASRRPAFVGSGSYWEARYSKGGTSGPGSYGRLATYKADYIRALLIERGIESAIEFGCGDGNQLSLIDYPRYVGVDVSITAVEKCRQRFSADASKTFICLSDLPKAGSHFDLSLSLDVIYHLVEDDIYLAHLDAVFSSSRSYVLIYSSCLNQRGSSHVRHRRFLDDVETRFPDWGLVRADPNPWATESLTETDRSLASFFLFEKKP